MAKKKRVIISSSGKTVVNGNDRKVQIQKIDASTPSGGASMQGPRQGAKGGPAGANQGGAPRGANRMEPSHTKMAKRTQGK